MKMLVVSQKKLPRIGCAAVNWLVKTVVVRSFPGQVALSELGDENAGDYSKEVAQDRLRCGDLVGENAEKPQMGNLEQSGDEAANAPHSKPRKKKVYIALNFSQPARAGFMAPCHSRSSHFICRNIIAFCC